MVAGYAVFVGAGCAADGEWSVRRALGLNDPMMPSMDKFPKPDYAVAERVDVVSKKIVVQNTFLGIDPLFHTLGVPESARFHRGPQNLFISEGLVKKCKSEDELAAVLCSELGQMVAEKRAVRSVGSDRETIPDAALPGGLPVDTGRQLELADQDRHPKPAAIDPVDAAKQARQIMTAAGFDPALLDQVQPLLKQSERGLTIRKQMSGSAPAPTWTSP